MATFAFTQHRLGRTDGVSLEVDKWRVVLEAAGHTVHYIAGNDDVPGGCSIPELYPFHPVMEKLIRNATRELTDYPDGAALMAEVEAVKNQIKPQYLKYIEVLGVDVLVPNNLTSVGYNLPGMWALTEVIEETGLPTIMHSHDFWWEDSGEVYPTCDEVVDLYKRCAPPDLPNIQHVVINRIAQDALKERKGLESRVVPNVFDFNRPTWTRDDYNSDLRASFGIGDNDLVFLQATRILDRKAVELAIDVIERLGQPAFRQQLVGTSLYDGRVFPEDGRIILLCAGYIEGIGLSASYADSLKAKAAELGVEVMWVGDHVKHSRGTADDGSKIYSLWDSYTAADFVTYPSVWEGWGNQFIEAVYAELPVVLFEYPVWVTDLKQTGFDVVSLGDTVSGKDDRGLVQVADDKLDAAASEIITLLQDSERRKQATDRNVALAREHYSLEALGQIVGELATKALAQ